MTTQPTSLGADYPNQQARIRQLIAAYEEFLDTPGVNVTFALAMLRDVQRRADEAAVSGDVQAMIGLYREMEACE